MAWVASLRKVMAQRRDTPAGYAENPVHTGAAHPAVQHMLLVDVPGRNRMERWLDTHPTLDATACSALWPPHASPCPPCPCLQGMNRRGVTRVGRPAPCRSPRW